MYTGLITKIKVSPIDGADKIQKGYCSGYTVVVGKEVKDEELGIFFPADGQLSKAMCEENNLYREKPNGEKNPGGYMENNRRVKTIKMLGIPSEGLWLPLNSLKWVKPKKFIQRENDVNFQGQISDLKEGDQLTHFNGVKICGKYYPRATREQRVKTKKKQKLSWTEKVKKWLRGDISRSFPRHFETEKLRHALGRLALSEDAFVYITRKMHGTSARSGKVRDSSVRQCLRGYFGLKPRYIDLVGTRRLILPHKSCCDIYRFTAHEQFKDKLKDGEIVYYEIVGFGENGPIMCTHDIKDQRLRKRYGETMTYSYGMKPVISGSAVYGENFDIYVYRITQDGNELSPSEIEKRCKELNVKMVPYVTSFHWGNRTKDEFAEECKVLSSQKNQIDHSHIHEGICIRILNEKRDMTLKYKSWLFCDLEGIAKNSDAYVDPEDL